MIGAKELESYMREDFLHMQVPKHQMLELEHEKLAMIFPIPLPQPEYYDENGIMGDFSIRVSEIFSTLFLNHRITKCTRLHVRETRRDKFRIEFEVTTLVHSVSEAEWNS